MNTLTILSKILPVVFLIAAGSLIRATGFLKPATVDELKKVVMNIALPSLLFFAFADTDFKADYLLIFASVFLACLLMLVIGMLLKKPFGTDNRFFPALFSGFETGMVGYSVYVAVFGADNMFKLALMDVGQVLFVFFVLVTFLQRQNGGAASLRGTLLSFVRSPVILSLAVGILVGAQGLLEPLEAFSLSCSVLETLRLLSNLTVPLICIVIGFELRISLKNLKKPLLCVLSRMALLLGLAALISELVLGRILQLDASYKIALYTMFLLPPPFLIPIFMKDESGGKSANADEHKQFVLNTISLHIILSLIAFLILILVVR